MKKFLLITALMLTGMATFAIEATVTSVTGKVEVQRGASWVAVKQGDTLQKGAVLSTGFNSEATLAIDGTTVTVGALTRMTIEQLAQNAAKDDTQVFIDSGKVSADVSHTENRRTDFKVRSPVATASVRGTSIEMYATGDFSVTEGMADYGPAESAQAVIQDDLPADEGARAQGEASVFTSAQEVGGTYGTPVFAGWSSTTDAATGERSNPQDRLAEDAHSFASSTDSLASREATGIAPYASNERDRQERMESTRIRLRVTLPEED